MPVASLSRRRFRIATRKDETFGMASLLIVEDEAGLREALAYYLGQQGHAVRTAASGAEALGLVHASPPDLVVLDLLLPDLSGTEVCRLIRQEPRTAHLPVLILTALDSEPDRVRGLELGADDYVVKPFPLRELELPIRAILRAARPPPGELCAGSLRLYEEGHRVLVDGRPLTPSRMEFRALGLLMERKGRVVRREEFLDRVWSEEAEISDRAVDTLVRRLRHALGPAASRIETIRGVGYRLRDD